MKFYCITSDEKIKATTSHQPPWPDPPHDLTHPHNAKQKPRSLQRNDLGFCSILFFSQFVSALLVKIYCAKLLWFGLRAKFWTQVTSLSWNPMWLEGSGRDRTGWQGNWQDWIGLGAAALDWSFLNQDCFELLCTEAEIRTSGQLGINFDCDPCNNLFMMQEMYCMYVFCLYREIWPL